MMYDKMKFEEKIAALATFEPPEDFTPMLSKENLKEIKAPIYDFRAQGIPVVPDMLAVVAESANPESARLGALIVLAHVAHKDGIPALIDALKSTEGRMSECAAVFLQLFYQEDVPAEIRKIASDSSLDKKIRTNAYLAIYRWASRKVSKEKEKLKRKRNEDVKALALDGLGSKDLDIKKLCIKMLPHISLNWEAEEAGKKSELVKVIEKVYPMLEHKDESLVAAAFESLNDLVIKMGSPAKLVPFALKYAKSGKKEVKLKAVKLLAVIFNTEMSETNKEDYLEEIYFILKDTDKDVLLLGIDIMNKHGKTAELKAELASLTSNADEEIASAAKAAQEAIDKRGKE
jgi:hypothetical protein